MTWRFPSPSGRPDPAFEEEVYIRCQTKTKNAGTPHSSHDRSTPPDDGHDNRVWGGPAVLHPGGNPQEFGYSMVAHERRACNSGEKPDSTCLMVTEVLARVRHPVFMCMPPAFQVCCFVRIFSHAFWLRILLASKGIIKVWTVLFIFQIVLLCFMVYYKCGNVNVE